MQTPRDWQAEAFNTSPDSDNEIHSHEMARSYGFRGGLVPGVVVSAYLIHPAVEAWGMDWLQRGHARVVVHQPTYDGDAISVRLGGATADFYRAELFDPMGALNASGEMRLADTVPEAPRLRGDPLLPPGHRPPPASLTLMQQLREEGLFALDLAWNRDSEMTSYLRDPAGMAAPHRNTGGGYANAAYLLGLTNWALAANVYMNPWIHLQTESQFYAPVAPGTALRLECAIQDLFSRKGHEFVDLDVNAFARDSGRAVMSARLRAIYRLRPGG